MSYLELAKQARRDEPKTKSSNPPTRQTDKSHARVLDMKTARTLREESERGRLLAAGWKPKERCGPLGLTIWEDPETGFYVSQDVALLRLRQAEERRREVLGEA